MNHTPFSKTLGVAIVAALLLAGMQTAPPAAATHEGFQHSPPFTDGNYHEYILYNVPTTSLDILIIPAASPYFLRDLQTIDQSVQMWRDGIQAMAPPWLRDGLEINHYTLGIDHVPPHVLANPQIVVISGQVNPVLLLGVGLEPFGFFGGQGPCANLDPEGAWIQEADMHHHNGSMWSQFNQECTVGGYTCFVVNTNFMSTPTPRNYRDMFDLNSHELGHCLGIGHVGDAGDFSSNAFPRDDIMSYQSSSRVKCVSSLNILAMERVYGHLLGQGGTTRPAGGYVHMVPSDWHAHACGEEIASHLNPDPLLNADPLGLQEEEGGEPTILIEEPGEGEEVAAGAVRVAGFVDPGGASQGSAAQDAAAQDAAAQDAALPVLMPSSGDPQGDAIVPMDSMDIRRVALVAEDAQKITFEMEVEDMSGLPPSADLFGLGGLSFKHGIRFCTTGGDASTSYASSFNTDGTGECYGVEYTQGVLGDDVSFSVVAEDSSGCGTTPVASPEASVQGDVVTFVVPRDALTLKSAPASLGTCGSGGLVMGGTPLQDGEHLVYLLGQTRVSGGLLVTANPTIDDAGGAVDPSHEFGAVEPLAADAGGPYSGIVGQPISILGVASGGAGAHACSWSGAGASFDDAGACSTTATYDEAGDFTLTLTVTDGSGDAAQDTAAVEVSEGERVEVRVGAELVGSTPVDSSSGRADWEAEADLSGHAGQTITLDAVWIGADGAIVDSDQVTVVVASGTEPLEADAGGPYSGDVGEAVAVSGGAAGGEEPYTFQWGSDGVGDFANASAATTTYTPHEAGTHTLTLTVTDDAGSVAADTAQLTAAGAEHEVAFTSHSDEDEAPVGPVLFEGTVTRASPGQAPTADVQPAAQTGEPGDPLSFTAAVTGEPACEWGFDGPSGSAAFVGATDSCAGATVSSDEEDAVTVLLTATNDAGSAQATATAEWILPGPPEPECVDGDQGDAAVPMDPLVADPWDLHRLCAHRDGDDFVVTMTVAGGHIQDDAGQAASPVMYSVVFGSGQTFDIWKTIGTWDVYRYPTVGGVEEGVVNAATVTVAGSAPADITFRVPAAEVGGAPTAVHAYSHAGEPLAGFSANYAFGDEVVAIDRVPASGRLPIAGAALGVLAAGTGPAPDAGASEHVALYIDGQLVGHDLVDASGGSDAWQVEADVAEGPQQVTAEWYDADGNLLAEAQITVTGVAQHSVQVTAPPDAGQEEGTAEVHDFTVTNTGDDEATFAFAVTDPEGWVTAGPEPAGATLAAGASATVGVEVTAGAHPGSATITLAASGDASDNASFTVTATAAPASITIETPEEGSTVGPDFNASGTFFAGAEGPSQQRAARPDGLANLRIPVPEGAHWNAFQSYDPLLPGLLWNDAIGPGTPIAMAFTPGATFPEFLCTANWVWKDDAGAVYLGAAGHCFLPEGTRTTHGASGSVPAYDPKDVTVWACAGDCVAGGWTGDIASIFLGNYIKVGDVEYARQKPATGRLSVDADGIGYDFGVVRIPDAMLDMVDPAMPVWGGPATTFTGDSFLMPMAMHGSGVLYGETFATKSRMGESLGSLDGRSWDAIIPSFGGDSGSSVSVHTGVSTAPPAAHGLLTHGIVGAPYAVGTLIGQATQMAMDDAGLCIRPLMAGEDPDTASSPSCATASGSGGDSDLGDPDTGDPQNQTFQVQVRLGDGDWADVDEQGDGTWSHALLGVEAGDHVLQARLVDDGGAVLAEDAVAFTVEEETECPGINGNGPPGQGCGQGPPCNGNGNGPKACREDADGSGGSGSGGEAQSSSLLLPRLDDLSAGGQPGGGTSIAWTPPSDPAGAIEGVQVWRLGPEGGQLVATLDRDSPEFRQGAFTDPEGGDEHLVTAYSRAGPGTEALPSGDDGAGAHAAVEASAPAQWQAWPWLLGAMAGMVLLLSSLVAVALLRRRA